MYIGFAGANMCTGYLIFYWIFLKKDLTEAALICGGKYRRMNITGNIMLVIFRSFVSHSSLYVHRANAY